MEIIIYIEIIIMALLIIANGILSMSELAIVSSRKIKLQKMEQEGNKNATRVLKLMKDPNQFLSTVQIGITLIGIFTGAFGGSTLSEPLGQFLAPYLPYSYQISLIAVVIITTYFSLIIGELVPKRIALNNPERMAVKTAKLMKFISKICGPLVTILSKSTNGVLKIIGIKAAAKNVVTEDEVKLLIEEGIEDGTIEKEEENIIKRVFRLDAQKVDMIMTPRNEMVWLDLEDDDAENKEKIINSKRSIFPVAEDELDDFIGVVQAKDILSAIFSGKNLDIKENLKEPLVVPENLPSMELLKQFKENREYVHMALVVDEFGSVVGLITLNDLLEGIVGDIPGIDETDDPTATERKDGSWLIDGRLSIDNFKEIFDIEEEEMPQEIEDGFTTIAGFILSYLGKIPETGEEFKWYKFCFEIVDMDGNHIDKILVKKVKPKKEDDEEIEENEE